MCRQRAGCNAGTLTAKSLVEAAARDVQAKGRLQPWSSKGWRPGLVEAAAKEWRVLVVLAEAWQTAGSNLTREGYVQAREGWRFRGRFEAWQTAGSNALTRESYVQAREGFRLLMLLAVWSLANGQAWNALSCREGYVQAKGRLQPWKQRLTAKSLVEAAARELQGFSGFSCNPGAAKADGSSLNKRAAMCEAIGGF